MIEKCFGVRRARQFHRFVRHCKVTFLCLLLTIVVLRGTIGAGKFGTPEQDFIDIRNRFSTARKLSEPHQRLLEEVNSKLSDSDSSYAAFDVKKLFPDDDDDDDNERKSISFSDSSSNYAESDHKKLFRDDDNGERKRNSEHFDKFSVKSSSSYDSSSNYGAFDHKKLFPDDDNDERKRDSEQFVVKSSSNYAALDHKKLFPDGNDGVKSSNFAAFDHKKLFPNEEDDVDSDEHKRDSESVTSNYTLGPKVVDWDETRENWLANHPQFPNFIPPKNKPRVLLVTGSSPKPCENPIGDHYLLKSIKNKIDYCRLHGIEIFYNMALLDAEMSGFWAKLPLIRTLLLSHPEFEFLWWMDSDAMFTDMGFEIPWERYKDYNLVMHGWREMVFDQKNWIGLNTGSFLIRNCQWSLDILDAWAKMGPKGKIRVEAGKLLTQELKDRPAFEADDQSAMVYLLAKEKEKWGNKVYLENGYYLHGYWAILVDHYEEFMQKYHPGLGDHRWPFVTHFVGCKPCGKVGDYPVERCLKQMERAFNFGDNQVLQMYGFAHESLASRRVRRIRNETSDHR